MDFQRPKEDFRISFGGWRIRDTPDRLPPDKFPLAVNIRAYSATDIRTRPGLSALFNTGVTPTLWTTDMRAYSALLTDDLPRFLIRNIDDTIWLDTGTKVGTLASNAFKGASLIPFRPNNSPNPYMYIANGADYQKFSAPPATNVVTQSKVGIAEPQTAPDAVPQDNGALGLTSWYLSHGNPSLTAGGTAAGATTAGRVTDTVGAFFVDPAYLAAGSPSPGTPTLVTLQVGSTQSYSRFMQLNIGGTIARVADVFPPIQSNIGIKSIYYFSGNTGKCIIVPSVLTSEIPNGESSIYGTNFLSNLRRGALIQVGSEVCFVYSVTVGPDNAIAIETSTVSNHTTADHLSGIPAISVVSSSTPAYGGLSISSPFDSFTQTVGIGTQSFTPLAFFFGSSSSYQSEDYIHLSVKIDDLSKLIEIRFLLDVGDGTFTQNFYYYTIRAADITSAVLNTITQLAAAQQVTQRAAIDEEAAIAAANQGVTFSGAQTTPGSSQWTEIMFPISQLTRVGSDESKSLQTLNKVQLLVNSSGSLTVGLGGVYVSGGAQVDAGDIGEPYRYRFVGRSLITGVQSNPSPATRYGVSPRRQQVIVNIPSGGVPYDPQITIWDVQRFGGTVPSWRFVGTVAPAQIGATIFIDNFGDEAANAGDATEFDNFEPWPSVDLPATATVTGGSGTFITVNTSAFGGNLNITSYLPGTQVRFNSANVYTLRSRPIFIGGTNNYQLEFEECVGSPGTPMTIQEPFIARRFLPYMWGPDVNGTVFAVGDSLRPGTLYFSKHNNPDSAPDTNNQEIVQPSEPLLGGEIVDGLAFVGSPMRWWALYPQNDPAHPYNAVPLPFPRGLAAPYAHCTDNKTLFYWAKDGIYGGDKSLTDEDLYQLFPHEGVAGSSYVYQGYTVPPPDYSQAYKFRLVYCDGYLYASYVDIGSTYHTLVLNTRTGAWSLDIYPGTATAFYTVEQQSGSRVLGADQPNPVLIVATLSTPNQVTVSKQQDLTNDLTTPITCALASFEFDGGDIRAPKQWGDVFIDASSPASGGISVQGESQKQAVGLPIAIPSNAVRTRNPYATGGIVISDFYGLYFTWTDDFTQQSQPTRIFAWQPSFVVQPATDIDWTTFGSSFGLKGFLHVRQLLVAYVATAPVTVTIVTYDGQDPPPITLPSTGGQFQKTTFPVGPNKGLLYSFRMNSTAPFQVFEDDSEVWVGQWGRDGAYDVFRNLGGRPIDAGVV